MRKTDISKYSEESSGSSSVPVGSAIREIFALIGKLLMTAFLVCMITGTVLMLSLVFYIVDISKEPLNISLTKLKEELDKTSYIYVMDEKGSFVPDLKLYSTENRVWVSFDDIPQHMIDAQIAIEDKRFYEHEGVDMKRTSGAVLSLATGGREYGGSTITQQLIKNITDDNEVSINRKLREIFRALKLESEYSKDDIIEAYLNIVNYGGGCRGVQSAARLYFDKNIGDCSVAECAAIAGITQNPYAFDPLVFPEKNKQRREIVIEEMYDQEKITRAQYDQAMEESANMTFKGYIVEGEESDTSDWDWYDDRVFRDVSHDLARVKHISVGEAEDMIYSEGLHIYSAKDKKAQEIAEKRVHEWKTPNDPELDVGYMLMDFDGRIFATVGGRQEKDGRLGFDIASMASLQPGSTIKPISSYAIALDEKLINYSSLVSDQPVAQWSGDGAGPNNWYGSYLGNITVTRALNISSNCAAVSVLNMIGMDKSYDFLTKSLGFKHLNEEHDSQNRSGLSIGGFYGGTTVEEMTASYMIFCNGGYYYEPYSYFYVTDNAGNVILDNRDRGKPDQVISTETATIMNRLLSEVVNAGGEGATYQALGFRVQISGWDIIGKTGTTDSSKDNWFVGASPYGVAGIWTGHKDKPAAIHTEEQSKVHYLWRDIMADWLDGKPSKAYNLGGNVEQHNYLKESGKLTMYSGGEKILTGYYTIDNQPDYDPKDPYEKPKPQKKPEEEKPDEDDPEESSEESEESSESEPEESSEDGSDDSSEESPDDSSEESPDDSSEDSPDDSSEESPDEESPGHTDENSGSETNSESTHGPA